MKRVFLFLSILVALFTQRVSAKECDTACQIQQVNAYFSALDAVAKSTSTEADIDHLLSLMHDDVKYIHVEYDAHFDKTSWRKAFMRNLSLGRYDNTERNLIKVLNTIPGKNHIAVEYSHGLIDVKGDWQPTDKYLAVFGFKDGRLALIKELW